MRPRHAAMADRRLVFVGAAAIFGAFVLLVLIMTSARHRTYRSKDTAEISPDLLNTEVPDRDPKTSVLIGQHQKASGDPLQSLQTGRGELEFTNDEGSLAFRYRWDKSDPLETGWNRFTNPQAWIYRSKTQLIHLSADEGRFRLAENRQPQSGVLTGHVIISLFEAGDQRGVYAIDTAKATPTAQFETDSLNFDVPGLSGRTDDRVIARTANMIVIGKGMTLFFNEQRGRIEKLEIEQRELIAYRQDEPAPQTQKEANRFSPAVNVMTHGAPRVVLASNAAPASRSPWDDATPYRLTLSKEVIISKGEDDQALVIHGRDLVGEFGMGGSDFGGKLTGAPSSSLPDGHRLPMAEAPAPMAGAIDRWSQLAAMPFGMVDQDLPDLTFLGSDRGIEANDVKITGVGGMLLVPIDETPDTLVRPDDLHATLDGDPVRIEYGPYYALGRDLMYSKSQQLVRLNCDRMRPLEAGIPGGARMTAVVPFDFHFGDPNNPEITSSKGILLGAGTLVGLTPKTPPPTDQPNSTSAMKGLPDGFSVNWLEDFTVEFKSTPESTGLGQIAAAVFNGTVHVDDPNGYALDSQQLRIDFKDKDQADTKDQGIESITATGDAKLQSGEGNVSGDELYVAFEENAEGASHPSQMTVTGHGRVVDTGGSIEAQYIQANLIEKSLASEEALPSLFGGAGRKSKDGLQESDSPAIGVTDVLAQGGVVLSFEGGVKAMADRLVADARTDTATLTGDNVVVSDPSLSVMGRRAEISNISSTENKRIAKFIGAGTLTYFEPRPNAAPGGGDGAGIMSRPVTTPEQMREELKRRLDGAPAAAPDSEPADGTSPDAQTDDKDYGAVHVDWADQLTFEEAEGRITFEGSVVADSEPSARETDRLTGNWMQIELTEPIPTRTPSGDPGQPVRHLRKMTMLGGHDEPAQIQAQRYTDDDRTQREMLLAIASEIIEYTEATELFEASGDGWMLVVDSKPRSNDRPTGDRDPGSAAVQFSGPGETEFSWTDKLSLDRGHGLLTITDDVVMRHRPQNEPVIRVDCDKMTASLKSQDPASAFDLSRTNGMELTSAVADGAVYVRREDRSIWSDRLTYDRAKLLATIESFDDNYVVMESDSTGGAVQARRILWDFFSNGITLEGARVDGPMTPVHSGR